MNLQFINYFVVLSETNNFTQAAKKVHVVQSAFSTGIKKLEEQMNCKLFYRDNRQVLLTDEGKQLLPKAKQLLAIWNDMESTFTQDYCKPLKLGVVSEIDFNAIAPVMKTFHERYPNHQVQVVEKSETELQRLLSNGGIDAYFLKIVPPDEHKLAHRLVRKDKLVLLFPENHPLATKQKLPFAAISGQDFIERTNCSLYEEVQRSLIKDNIKPNFVFQAKGDDMAKALVASGIGISLVPDIGNYYPNIKTVTIADKQFYRRIYLIWNKENTSNSLRKFLSI